MVSVVTLRGLGESNENQSLAFKPRFIWIFRFGR
jgi:hypothetical protein